MSDFNPEEFITIPDGWSCKRLADCTIDGNISYGIVQPGQHVEDGVSVIRINNVNNGQLELSDVLKVSPEIESKYERTRLKGGEVLLTLVGSTGQSFVAPSELKGWNVPRAIAVIRVNKDVGAEWINLCLQSKNTKHFLNVRANTTVQKTLNLKDVRDIPILVPPKETKAEIESTVLSFSKKIELLREQNKTLETLAQTIFKEWFVHFNFPDPHGKPYRNNGGEMVESELGLIPQGWRVERLGEALEVKRGGSPRPIQDYLSDSGYRWLKISDASASPSPFIFEIKEHIKKEGLKKTTLLKKGSLVLSNSATPGIPKFLELDSCIHDGWLHFPSTNIFSYQYLYLFFLHIRKPLLQQGNGSVFKNLKTDILKGWMMVIPDLKIMNDFNELTAPIFEKIKNNASQVQSLSKTRDTLLPKLMCGQVKVQGETV